MAFLGIDVGSVSVKTALITTEGKVLAHEYRRHYGRPLEVARAMLAEAMQKYPDAENLGCTGSGGKQFAEMLGLPFENEMLCQARAAAHLTPEAQTLIVVGGEDSFMLMMEDDGAGEMQIRDFAMNGLCAAGCGSFLDQQASRLGVNIDEEFGALAVASARPARVAGRCSVFAKTDMIHLQQKATPVCDIVAGLCFAFARNFVAVLARGKDFTPPVVFHGGVAQNAGMVRAFTEVLELKPEQFLVPEHAATAGAVGAALLAAKAGARDTAVSLQPLDEALASTLQVGPAHPPLPDPGPPPGSHLTEVAPGPPIDAYLGVDIGSISTNVVLIDSQKRVLAKSYLMTAGRPIEAVRKGLAEVSAQFADKVIVRGVCTTGSGRYLIGDFLGADVVKNEITAQARAAAEIDPEVDTIFEIGGQDSKYIKLENGAIVDFEMNKVCAAGTGSFLEEQAERLGVSIKGEFAQLALSSKTPVRLGERCTVFMESDLVGQQSRGASTADLAAGLAYSIVHNYLNRVVSDRAVGDRIFFQGGTAFNRAVVAAFRQVTGKPVTVPEHHEVTGAIGCALMAREEAQPGVPSKFKGWDLSKREYKQDSFECKSCANRCEINRVHVEGEQTLFYGGRCEKFEKRRAIDSSIPDLFAEREALMLSSYQEPLREEGKPLIGMPRTLHFLEYAPFWLTFFKRLGLPVKLSDSTAKGTINVGLDAIQAEFCFPVKVAHGHCQELIESDVTHIFLPCVGQLPKLHEGYEESVPCPYVQSMAYTIRAALLPDQRGVKILEPFVDLGILGDRTIRSLHEALKELKISKKQVTEALKDAQKAQDDFTASMLNRGREILASLGPDDRAVIVVSRPYNGCDNGINLEIPTRFRELGMLPIPLDMIPLEEADLSDEFPGLSWRYGQKILGAAELIREDPRLHAVYITNFGCGPDSFLTKFFRARMGDKPFLQLEIDEHSSDVGAITRCEAFLDSMKKAHRAVNKPKTFRLNFMERDEQRVIYVPHMTDEAFAVAAAFRSVGQPADVTPPSEPESVAVAKRHCTGKECFPCIVTTGDLISLLRRPDINPDHVAFFMPSVAGGCRFGYYNILQRLILDELGYDCVPIFAPNQDRGLYDTLGDKAGDQFVRRAWQGIVAVELLSKALYHVRPHEKEAGQTDNLYQDYLKRMQTVIEAGQDLLPLMREARADFAKIPVDTEYRPWIGIVGEIFVRMNSFSNQDLVRRIEEMGGKVWMAPFTEWMYYVNNNQQEDAHFAGKWADMLKVKMVDQVMKSDQHHLTKAWDGFLPNGHEHPVEHTLNEGKRYIDPVFRGEGVLCVGKAVEWYHHGLAGVVNAMPFTCMPGTIVTGVFKRFQSEHDRMPVLNLSFDGQETDDLGIRLEAFIQQCRSYQQRHKSK